MSLTTCPMSIAKGNPTSLNAVGFEFITPYRILLGRNNARGLAGEGVDLNMRANLQKMWPEAMSFSEYGIRFILTIFTCQGVSRRRGC